MQGKSSQGIRFARLFTAALFTAALACDKAEPLTAQKAQEIISRYQFQAEPVYAEVPQRVWWNERAPKDDFDEKSLRTLDHLAKAGYVTVTQRVDPDGTQNYFAKATQKGFPILGTAPSYRGPVYRGKIAEKKYDGLRNFVRHPNEQTTGHAELVWHYANPTPLYDMFETKMNKPLNKPFASLVSFYYKDREWRFDVTVRKTETQ
ncbi:MAG: hypothetical protein JOZ54_24635 [Acidobacteria bacterium]|nr:hypothetical protein [Acidobacteriota bacterium]